MQIYPDFAPQAFAVANKPAVAAGTPLGQHTRSNGKRTTRLRDGSSRALSECCGVFGRMFGRFDETALFFLSKTEQNVRRPLIPEVTAAAGQSSRVLYVPYFDYP